MVGNRFCLLGQAAGFVDPLFSKGLYMALTCTSVLAERLLTAKTTGDYSAQQFQPLEDLTLAYLQANDQLVAHAYKSFSDYRLWAPFSVLWLTGAYLELVKLTSLRALTIARKDYYQQLEGLKLVGGGFPAFEQLAQEIYDLLDQLDAPDTAVDIPQLTQQITQRLERVTWMPFVFKAVLHGKNHLPRHKFHPRLFRPQQGFLGTGWYRRHFFANRSLPFFLNFYLRERVKYSTPMLQLKRRIGSRSRHWVRPEQLKRAA